MASALSVLIADFFDERENFFAAEPVLTRGDEPGWQRFPVLAQFVHKHTGVLVEQRLADTVGLGENDSERNLSLSECINEININFLGRQVGVNKHKGYRELLAFDQIVVDHRGKIILFLFGNAGEAISRQVNQVPVFIDQKKIEQTGFARGGGDFRESVSAGEHIDERGLAHIGTPDEGEFGQFGGRAEFLPGERTNEIGGSDIQT